MAGSVVLPGIGEKDSQRTEVAIRQLAQQVQVLVAQMQVLGARDTGWTPMTGTFDKSTAYATSTVTLAQLAARVAELQAILTAHGIIGP